MMPAQASTQFFFNLTAFTLSNFTSAFNINVTNINGTNVVPAGEHACNSRMPNAYVYNVCETSDANSGLLYAAMLGPWAFTVPKIFLYRAERLHGVSGMHFLFQSSLTQHR